MKHFKDFLEEGDSLSSYRRHKVQVTASKDGGSKQKINVKVMANSEREAKGMARAHLHKKGYTTHSATHHGIDYDWLKKEEALCPKCGMDPCQCGEVVDEEVELQEGAYEKSEENKRSADAAKKQGDMFAHHLHMADHHDNLAQWHGEKGRHGEAEKHAEKAEQHHEKAMALKEEVEQINELSNDTLSSYKKKAGESASAADKAGKFDLGHKRFKGIMKATFKQFMNDAKK